MRAASGRTATIALGLMLMLVASGCGAAPAGPSVPTFDDTSQATGSTGVATPGPDEGAIPDDCAKLIAAGDLGALLGLPLDSVTLRTTRHVAAPAIGRTERVACEYTGQGSVRGRLLALDVSSYTSDTAARDQWQVNVEAEDGTQQPLPIGAASGVLIQRGAETALRVVHGASNLVFVLPHSQLPDSRSPADTLVDLALRVIPAIDATPSEPGVSAQPAGTGTN
jgi:hypothetical protein